MIFLHTGQPGAGKTLYTIATVSERAKKEGRSVFFSGITECKVPGWVELPDPENWASVPDGSIIVIDEAQRIFRPRHVGAKVPEYVELLETHRHRGLDLYLVTQHPSLVETNVRRLTGTHRHLMRMFGTRGAQVHEWNEVRTECDTKRDGSISSTWIYPKEVFTLYKSAEVHTHKARIPMRVWMLILAPVLLVALGYGAYYSIRKVTHLDGSSVVPGAAPGVQADKKSGGRPGGGPLTAAEWIEARQPRLQGLAYTAPAYDAVTQPSTAPYPAVCLASESKCRCYTQQATRLDMPDALCRSIAERGYFKDWQDSSERGSREAGRTLAAAPATAGAASGPSAIGSAIAAPSLAPSRVGPMDSQGTLPRVMP